MRRIGIYFFIVLFFCGCIANQKITYRLNDISKKNNSKLSALVLDVEIFEDLRKSNIEDSALFTKPRATKILNERVCINSEQHYKKKPVNYQVSQLISDYFRQQGIYKVVTFNKKDTSDYYLTAKLKRFYGNQRFSTAAAVGAQFGLIGALATANTKTKGKIEIELSDIKLFDKNGKLIKGVGNFKRTYEEDYHVDGYCWCIYFNVNDKFKFFTGEFSQLIESSLSEELSK